MASERLTFDRGTLAFAEGREFRKIRYRMVRLSDRPDEIQGYELGRLDEGDEVEVLERSGFYVKIRTPFGMEGWVHRTTVGAQLSTEQDRAADSTGRAYTYVGPDDSLVTRLLRERSAV
jgi:SH3 domain-containing protein